MQMRGSRRPILWLLVGVAVLGAGYLWFDAASGRRRTERYELETRWGSEPSGGTHRVRLDLSRTGSGTDVEYSIHMDPPGQTAGCRTRAEQEGSGLLRFRCNDGWNPVRGLFRASEAGGVLQIDNLDPGGGGLGAFYGEHTLRRTGDRADEP